MLSIKIDAVLNSSALLPNPVLSLIPKSIGDTIPCPNIIFSLASSDKNWYCACASGKWIGSISAFVSALSLNAIIALPLFELPLNFSLILLSIAL